MNDLVGTPENPDIVDHLRSGLDNADAGADGKRELGGVLLTMNEAADEIERLRSALTSISNDETDAFSANPLLWPSTAAFIALGGEVKDGKRVYQIHSKEPKEWL